jgi:hypothetical protein
MEPSITHGLLRPGRVDLDKARLVIGPVHREERGKDDHAGVQQTVRNNLRWMPEKYVGCFFWKLFKGRSYRGLILKVEWCAVRGMQ